MRRDPRVIHGILAALMVALGLIAWSREPRTGPKGVELVDVRKKNLKSVTYEDAHTRVELVPSPTENMLLARVSRPEKVTPEGTTFLPPIEFRANAEGVAIFEQFHPFKVDRLLGTFTDDELGKITMGDKLKRKVTVATKSGDHQLRVFILTSTDRAYVKPDPGDKVFYHRDGMPFLSLARPMDRIVDGRLHAFELASIDKVVIQKNQNRRELKAAFVDKDLQLSTAQGPDDAATAWHKRLWTLVVARVYARGERPRNADPRVVARVEYYRGATMVGWADLAQANSEQLMRTEHSIGWMSVPALISVSRDIDTLFGSM